MYGLHVPLRQGAPLHGLLHHEKVVAEVVAHHVGVILEFAVALLELVLQAGALPYLGLELLIDKGEPSVCPGKLGSSLRDFLLHGLVCCSKILVGCLKVPVGGGQLFMGFFQCLLRLYVESDVLLHHHIVDDLAAAVLYGEAGGAGADRLYRRSLEGKGG